MDIPMPDENVRVAITLSSYDYKRLKLWALVHGRSPATYAAQIVSARIEANFDTINKLLEDYARTQGKTLDEILASVDSVTSGE
jgi:hypothetical protein